MPIDYSLLKFSKGTPKALAKDARDNAREAADERENVKVRARSGGRCEVKSPDRCERIANQIHHMIGGSGNRARGKSLLAKHKQHVCGTCHPLITSKRLVRIGGETPVWSNTYRRLRASRSKVA